MICVVDISAESTELSTTHIIECYLANAESDLEVSGAPVNHIRLISLCV